MQAHGTITRLLISFSFILNFLIIFVTRCSPTYEPERFINIVVSMLSIKTL